MKVLIANRGEIAVRVIRTCREMRLGTVAVYSDSDREALHVRMADEAYPIGGSPAADSYLNIGRLVDAARRSGAALVHPGYGFLSENAEFAQACADAGLVFVGPSPDAIRRMGDKSAAREVAVRAGVPIVPGTARPFEEDSGDARVAAAAADIGYPLLVKAVAGGGGKGMRTVLSPEELAPAVRMARSEAASAFGNGAIYLERRLERPRHVEVQLLADRNGTIIPFVERECSIQRRHQKVVEESPSTAIDTNQRRAMADAAVAIARAVSYTNAGTIEFLLDASGQFFFLEMNTRLQVEHPITEAVTGVDLVAWQIRVARGERVTVPPLQALTPRGHAIECRVYAEDPDSGFLPSPGLVRSVTVPGGPGVRDDRGVSAGSTISVYYDSLIAKLIVWADTRSAAIARLGRALDEYDVSGVSTTLPFFRWLVRQPEFLEGRVSTAYLDGVIAAREGRSFAEASPADEQDAVVAAALAAWFRAHRDAAGPRAGQGSAWRRAARTDGLR
jgi:acetyl-CoA carboxylase, biotin carboxylase subunit